MRRLVIVTTVPLSLATLIKGQPKYLSKYFNIYLVTSDGDLVDNVRDSEGVELITVNMSREITPLQDLKS